MSKKRSTSLWLCTCILITLVICASSQAETVYFEGEGYIEPTPASQAPLTLSNRTLNTSTGDQINVNVQANSFPYITLYTTVLDSSGNAVSNLTQGDFQVAENSGTGETIQTITGFSSQSQGGAQSGINICLVFDVSGSMAGSRIQDAKQAAINFVNNCDPDNDRIGLVSFSSASSVKTALSVKYVYTDENSNGTYDIIDAIESLSTGGSTAVYNGTSAGIDSLSQEAQPKAVIAFSDGQTNSDTISINDVITKALNSSVPLYTCGFYYDSSQLQQLAAQTGGKYQFAPGAQEMEDFYNTISGGLITNYTINYTTTNPAYDGTTRTVTVTHDNGITIGSGIYVVNYKPSVTLSSATLALSSGSQMPDQALTIAGTIRDDDAQSQVQTLTATLFYRHVNSASYTSQPITLTYQSGGNYAFSELIPATTVQEPGVQCYIYVSDGIKETYSPFNYDTVPYSIPVSPNNAPSISHSQVTSASCNQAITVEATVVESDNNDSVSRVALFYRAHDENQITPYHILEMPHIGGNVYSAAIPADAATENGIDYFISAWDSYIVRADDGTSSSPHFIQISCSGGPSTSCSIVLDVGWNIFGYCGQTPVAVATALQSISGSYELVWGFDNGAWQMYDPTYPAYSDLVELEPCHGYWIEMLRSATLTFP